MKKFIAVSLLMVTLLPLGRGEEVLSALTNAAWVTPHWRKFEAMDEFLAIRGWVDIYSRRSFEVEPEAEYELSGMFRTPDSQSELSRFEFGFDPIDADGNRVAPVAVQSIRGTFSALVAPANVGDKEVKVKKNGKWQKNGTIAFNAKKDFSDLPNKNTVRYSKAEEREEILILTLKESLNKSYREGCGVRNHVNNRLWTGNRFEKVPKAWTKFSGKIKGISKDAVSNNQWWPGTERARIFILVPEKAMLEFKDVTVRKISAED